jgi:N-glycosylase/DNA lyase
MNLLNRLAAFYLEVKGNRWFRYFATFCRIGLALSFIPSGMVKMMG